MRLECGLSLPNLAEAGARQVLEAPSGMPPQVAIWYLSSLIAVERRLGGESRAREVLARCEDLLETSDGTGVHRSWRDSGATALLSLTSACCCAGFYEDALRCARRENDGGRRARLVSHVAASSGSITLARRVLEDLESGRDRLDLALSVCDNVAAA
jgi:hypothetical protein